MTDKAIQLDNHRGMAAQKATELRRLLAAVQTDQSALKQRQEELEDQMTAGPSDTWHEAAEKAQYLISLLAATSLGRDPRRRKLIQSVLQDLRRLSAGRGEIAD